MVQISDINKIADAARLALTAEEEITYQTYMTKMLTNFNKLNAIDTSHIEATIYSIPMGSVLRSDDIKPSLPKEKVMNNAPETIKGYFRVPRILEE